jgi:MSHA pilin protein MshA
MEIRQPASGVRQEFSETEMVKSAQHGFTLIELVVVIVILGILAAFAVPRFMGMEGEARAATVKSLGGTLQAAATMARAKCQAQGCGAAGTVTFEGQNITMVFGYPNRDSIDNTLTPTSLQGFNAATNPTATSVQWTKVGGGATCWVRYTQAPNANTPPTITYGVGGAVGTQAFNAALANAC